LKIDIEKHNPNWIIQYKHIKDQLSSILNCFNPVIEHIGSTSIPSLSAKPIIDVAVGITNISDLNKTISPMIDNQYIYYEVYNEHIPKRRFFVGLKKKNYFTKFQNIYSKNDNIPHDELQKYKLSHIHIWQYKSDDWIRHIAFRDYLIEHPNDRLQYEKLKMELSEKEWFDGNEYNDSKNDFIKNLELKAILWYQNINQSKN
tara:strand:- start:2362 stop:2967 length:606 start_codon:yes stop_codon:yes gene_type:complete